MSTIKIKNSTTPGNRPSSLAQGELAINVADGKIFYGTSGGSVTEFSGGGSTINSSSLATTGSNTFVGNQTVTGSLFLTGSRVTLGDSTITGSLSVTNGITGSLQGTASYASNADLFDGKDSNTFATTGSNTFIGTQTITGSFNLSGSFNQIGNYTHTGSIYHSGSKYLNGIFVQTGSLTITGSTTQIGDNTLAGNTVLSGSIIISGSTTSPVSPTIKIYGDMETNGVIKFMPVSKNIDTSISASYIYVSGSTNDLYFSQNGGGYNNVTRLRWLEGNLYTGILNGGLITTQSSTVYQVGSGSGIIVNLNTSYNNNPYPTIQYLNWPNLSSSIAPYSASYDQQFIAVTASSGVPVITSQPTPYTDGDYNTRITIGIVIHQNHSTINAIQTFPSVGYGWKQRSFDFIKAFGPLKISGYTLSPSGSSTGSLVLSGGTSWVDGRNYIVDPSNPSYIVEATGITTSKIYRYRQSGSDWAYDTNNGAGYVTIDPANYSNNGVLTPVGTNDWTIQRVFYFPNSATKAFYIYYGNATYSSKDNAIAAIATETFTEAPNTAANAIFVGYMILRHNADFTTAASYQFNAAGLFRGSGQGGASGGGGTTTPGGSNTQIQYNNNGAFGGVTNLTWNGTTLSATGSFTGSFTGSLFGTASWATNFVSASNYVLNSSTSSFATTGSNTLTGTQTFTTGGIIIKSTIISGLTQQTTDFVGSVGSNIGVGLGATTGNTYGSIGVRNSGGSSAGNLAIQSAGGNVAIGKTTANAVLDVNGNTIITGSLTVAIGSSVELYATSTGVNIGNTITDTHNITGSLNLSGSSVIIGTLAIGTSSLGPNENTLTLGARDSVNEGGQIGFNAPGGAYTASAFLDLYQNRFRILKGTNAGSTGEAASWNLSTLQAALPAYTSATSFPGTAVAGLAVDSGGNILTQAYVDTGETAYPSSSVVFTGTAPTGIVSSSYQASQIGNTVTLWIWQVWTNPSTTTAVTALLPAGVANPISWAGFTAANSNLYVGNFEFFQTTTTSGAIRNGPLYLRRNSAGNGFILDTGTIASTGARQFTFRIQYRTG